LFIALGVRLWELGTVPAVFFCDECDNTAMALRILDDRGPHLYGLDWKPQPAFAVHQLAACLRATGPHLWSVRLPSALLSVVALIPFFCLASRASHPLAAWLAALGLACHPGYLHFSRAGWENVQIGLWSLLAMEAVVRGTGGGRLWWWSIGGVSAALGGLVYFSGWSIIVFLALYLGMRLALERTQRRRVMLGAAVLFGVFALSVCPLVPYLWTAPELFHRRPASVLLTTHMPPSAGRGALVSEALRAGLRSAVWSFTDAFSSQQPRYHPPQRPLLGPLEGGLFLLGLAASLRRRGAGLWWLALLVPFVLTQMLTVGTPDLARGIGLLPVAYLFVSLGAATLLHAVRTGGRWGKLFIASILLVNAALDAWTYFRWARSARLSEALQPAVELAEFRGWWELQRQWVRHMPGFFTVDMWRAGLARAATPPSPAAGLPSRGSGPGLAVAWPRPQDRLPSRATIDPDVGPKARAYPTP
jgi:4-amino-4-deoxy-L-arabinose transferase-like glycosyltransferase